MENNTPQLANGLWFDDNAVEAVQFYQTVFPDVQIGRVLRYGKEGFEIHKRPEGSIMSIDFTIWGTRFQAINGGPVFQKNPSISYFVLCNTAAEAREFWNALSEGGKILMPLDRYEWSESYGWLEDKFGLSWQIYTGQRSDPEQRISPALMFSGEQHGRAEEAMQFYTSLFDDGEIMGVMKFPAGGTEPEGTVMHAEFRIAGRILMAMDSSMEHGFGFNEGVSLIVICRTQEAIDSFWNKLADGGSEIECGWVKDRFGVAWQVVPEQLDKMLADPDKTKAERVTKAFLKMKKLDIRQLEEAYKG
jgi:predicted 3-demethylubiquinone-9 3-methyltransferase (glyoxalase superfamily)